MGKDTDDTATLGDALFDIVHALQSNELSERVGSQHGPAWTGLTVRLLWYLGNGRTYTQSALAREAGISNPTASKAIARMEAAGLVQRVPGSDDRRTKRVVLTAAGEDATSEVRAVSHELIADAAASLTPSETGELVRLLAPLRARLRAAVFPVPGAPDDGQ